MHVNCEINNGVFQKLAGYSQPLRSLTVERSGIASSQGFSRHDLPVLKTFVALLGQVWEFLDSAPDGRVESEACHPPSAGIVLPA